MRAKLLTLLFVCGFQSSALSLVPVFTKNFVAKVTKAKTLSAQSSQKERYGRLGSEERGSGSHSTKRTTATVGKTAAKSSENDEEKLKGNVMASLSLNEEKLRMEKKTETRASFPEDTGLSWIRITDIYDLAKESKAPKAPQQLPTNGKVPHHCVRLCFTLFSTFFSRSIDAL